MSELTLRDLLKPLKDVLLKNWSTSLAHVLDDFVNHLQQEHIAGLNFSEAAVVIQNSTNFYCKRLDHVFKLIEELTDNITTFENCRAASTADNASSPKRRRLGRELENDDLEILGFVIPDHTTDLTIAKLKNVLPLKHVVLNKDVKAVKKPNTAVPLSNSAGLFFGHKDDYRLFGKTWSDGTANRDYEYSTSSTSFQRMDVDPVENDCDDDTHSPSDNCDMLPSDGLPSPSRLEGPPEEPAQMISPPPPMKQLLVKLKKIEDWEPITFDFNFHPKALKRRRVFSLPKALVDEAKVEMEKMEKRLKRAEKRASKLLETAQVQTEDSQDTGYVSELDPASLDVTVPVNGTSQPSDGKQENEGRDEIRDFKLKRRESAQAAAEVAARVSEWHDKMAPRLEEAEKRKKFNVHQYADVILDKFDDDDKSYKPFSEIIAGEPWDEVSRYFLAMLCLANTYNVDIRKNSNAHNDFSIRLLSKIRHHDELDRQVDNLS